MPTVLITGCSTGIGYATAVAMSDAGFDVFAGVRNVSGALTLTQTAEERVVPITIVQMDVDSDDSVASAVAKVLGAKGKIDILVNNAGVIGLGSVEETSLAECRRVMETNFFGVLRCVQAVVPHMRKNRTGHIINVSSLAGLIGLASQASYSASKWAVEAMSEVLAQEVSRFGIRVNLIEPGLVDTAFFTKRPRQSWSKVYPPNPRMLVLRQKLVERAMPASEIASKILEIVNSRNSQFRHVIGVDAMRLLTWRRSMSDEQWIALAGHEGAKEWLDMDVLIRDWDLGS